MISRDSVRISRKRTSSLILAGQNLTSKGRSTRQFLNMINVSFSNILGAQSVPEQELSIPIDQPRDPSRTLHALCAMYQDQNSVTILPGTIREVLSF
jgi:hypothetical protein